MFGVKFFHTHLYGRQFKIYTDHKPLLDLPESNKQIPTRASTRILRWAVFLSSYSYQLNIEMARVMVTPTVLADYHCQLKSRMSISLVT